MPLLDFDWLANLTHPGVTYRTVLHRAPAPRLSRVPPLHRADHVGGIEQGQDIVPARGAPERVSLQPRPRTGLRRLLLPAPAAARVRHEAPRGAPGVVQDGDHLGEQALRVLLSADTVGEEAGTHRACALTFTTPLCR